MKPAKADQNADTQVFMPVPEESAILKVRAFGVTDKGRVRESNQDQFLIAELRRILWVQQSSLVREETEYSQHRAHVFVVADGMGGHQGGEIASELAVTSIENFLLNSLRQFVDLQPTDDQGVLKEFQSALVQADAQLNEAGARTTELLGMGTTLTLALVSRSKAYIAHVGDSRCYLYSNDHLQAVTRDHTLVAQMVEKGVLTPEEASTSRARHVVTNVLGSRKGVQPELHKLELQADDVFLLCSDGLSGMVSDEQLEVTLKEEPDPQAACARLVAKANENGGKDNITVIVVRFQKNE